MRSMLQVPAVLLLLLALAACDDKSNDDDDADDECPTVESPECFPGATQACLCAGGTGAQTCQPDGLSWGGCECPDVFETVCGDGVLGLGEACDSNVRDCFTSNGFEGRQTCMEDCSEYQPCTLAAICGNGVIDPGEVCEDPWGSGQWCANPDGYRGRQECLSCTELGDCVAEERCGDGSVNGTEECDSAYYSNELREYPCLTIDEHPGVRYCRTDCSFSTCQATSPVPTAICGNGVIEEGERCEPSMSCLTADGYAGVAECTDDCSYIDRCVASARCGDGKVSGPEECDGEAACSATCHWLASDCVPLDSFPDLSDRVFVLTLPTRDVLPICWTCSPGYSIQNYSHPVFRLAIKIKPALGGGLAANVAVLDGDSNVFDSKTDWTVATRPGTSCLILDGGPIRHPADFPEGAPGIRAEHWYLSASIAPPFQSMVINDGFLRLQLEGAYGPDGTPMCNALQGNCSGGHYTYFFNHKTAAFVPGIEMPEP